MALVIHSEENVVDLSCEGKQNTSGSKSQTSSSSCRHMFSEGFVERHDLEQYFWTSTTVEALRRALMFEQALCCLSTPSIAHAFWTTEGTCVPLLDIDTRFNYLPGFRYWDLRHIPSLPVAEGESFRVLVFDPPFFYIPMDELYRAVLAVCKGDTGTRLLIGFLIREEATLMKTFKDFGLRRTKFVLEYATVKPNKWRNYALYSNVDLPGIKRVRDK